MRPVLNISEPLDVAVHVYIMHVSVNQLEQTITLNGHIYMVCLFLKLPVLLSNVEINRLINIAML